MAEQITPQQIQMAAKAGFNRLETYRKARAAFIKAYVGQYYQQQFGLTGNQPINLLFNAVRVMVPNLVMKNPVFEITTDYVEHKLYAELLAKGANITAESIDLKALLRAWIVDALFGFGITNTTLNSSQYRVTIDDLDIDPGQTSANLVSLDNFTFDPTCTQHLFKDAMFVGHATVVPRQQLLDVKGYDHDLVKQIPTIDNFGAGKEAKDISEGMRHGRDLAGWRELIKVVELYIPQANALVTIPDPRIITFDKYIRMTEYYGPDSGPYSFLSFTPPVPDNPFPVAPISMWLDIHNAANVMFKKVMEQALEQKDVLFYNPSEADAAQDALEAKTGESVACNDPTQIQMQSFGGQKQSNESMLTSLQTWFSYMAGNIEQLGGTRSSSATATQAEILQSNANVTIEDARDILYDQTAEIGSKLGWYLHTDPLIDLPIPYRINDTEEITIHLTPEERRGDFLEYVFKTKAKSMTRLSPALKAQKVLEFATNVIPAAANAAMVCMQTGTAFNFKKYVMNVAEEMGIEGWVAEVFEDPEFQQKLQTMLLLGPKGQTKKPGGPITSAGVAQNGGFPMARNVPTAGQQTNMDQQAVPAMSQAARLGA